MKKLMILFLCVMGVISGAEQADEFDGTMLHKAANICNTVHFEAFMTQQALNMYRSNGNDIYTANPFEKNTKGETAREIVERNLLGERRKGREANGDFKRQCELLSRFIEYSTTLRYGFF